MVKLRLGDKRVGDAVGRCVGVSDLPKGNRHHGDDPVTEGYSRISRSDHPPGVRQSCAGATHGDAMAMAVVVQAGQSPLNDAAALMGGR